jgi:TrpR-related protein YerC/YecD
MKTNNNPDIFAAILTLKSAKELENFFNDLCTPRELLAFKERWEISKLLDQGGLSYREISDQTGASTTTVTRVARFLTQQNNKGYREVLDRLSRAKS